MKAVTVFVAIQLPAADLCLTLPWVDGVALLVLRDRARHNQLRSLLEPNDGAKWTEQDAAAFLLAHPLLAIAGLCDFGAHREEVPHDVPALFEWIVHSHLADGLLEAGSSTPSAASSALFNPHRREVKLCAAFSRFRPWRGRPVRWRRWYKEFGRLFRRSAAADRKAAHRLMKRVLARPMARDLTRNLNALLGDRGWLEKCRSRETAMAAEWIQAREKQPPPAAPANGAVFDQALQAAKLESLRQLAYGASHELNNPLANIAMRAQTLQRGESCPDRRRRLQTIEQQALRAHDMISDMMLFAKPPAPHFDRVDLGELIRSVAVEFETCLAPRQIELSVAQTDDLSQWSVDITQFAECLRALFKNAAESIGQAGTINVESRRSGDDAVVTVRDSGVGIGEGIVVHLFDPFFSGREAGRGLGFGLSKAWRIAGLHGGRLECSDPRPGRTTFTLTLPREQRCRAEP